MTRDPAELCTRDEGRALGERCQVTTEDGYRFRDGPRAGHAGGLACNPM
jgi:hypothetical protein